MKSIHVPAASAMASPSAENSTVVRDPKVVVPSSCRLRSSSTRYSLTVMKEARSWACSRRMFSAALMGSVYCAGGTAAEREASGV